MDFLLTENFKTIKIKYTVTQITNKGIKIIQNSPVSISNLAICKINQTHITIL